jgi:5-methylcytosine-specific restriction endonuclease McrA
VDRNIEKTKRRKELCTMPYEDYLKTPEWNKIRLRALKRVKYRCQVCNKKDVLNVHHRTYERRGHEKIVDLVVLCKDCHKLFHFPNLK